MQKAVSMYVCTCSYTDERLRAKWIMMVSNYHYFLYNTEVSLVCKHHYNLYIKWTL